MGSDHGDDGAVDQNVSDVGINGGNNAAVLYQGSHKAAMLSQQVATRPNSGQRENSGSDESFPSFVDRFLVGKFGNDYSDPEFSLCPRIRSKSGRFLFFGLLGFVFALKRLLELLDALTQARAEFGQLLPTEHQQHYDSDNYQLR